MIEWILAMMLTLGLVVLQGWIFQVAWNYAVASYFHLVPMGLWPAVVLAAMIQVFFKPKVEVKGK